MIRTVGEVDEFGDVGESSATLVVELEPGDLAPSPAGPAGWSGSVDDVAVIALKQLGDLDADEKAPVRAVERTGASPGQTQLLEVSPTGPRAALTRPWSRSTTARLSAVARSRSVLLSIDVRDGGRRPGPLRGQVRSRSAVHHEESARSSDIVMHGWSAWCPANCLAVGAARSRERYRDHRMTIPGYQCTSSGTGSGLDPGAPSQGRCA